MTRITDGKKLINVYMGTWIDGSGYGPDETGDLIGAAYLRYDETIDAIMIEDSVEDFITWAHEWEIGEDEWTHESLLEVMGTDAESDVRDQIESRYVEISDPVNVEE